jgi:hypothetical protein
LGIRYSSRRMKVFFRLEISLNVQLVMRLALKSALAAYL